MDYSPVETDAVEYFSRFFSIRLESMATDELRFWSIYFSLLHQNSWPPVRMLWRLSCILDEEFLFL